MKNDVGHARGGWSHAHRKLFQELMSMKLNRVRQLEMNQGTIDGN